MARMIPVFEWQDALVQHYIDEAEYYFARKGTGSYVWSNAEGDCTVTVGYDPKTYLINSFTCSCRLPGSPVPIAVHRAFRADFEKLIEEDEYEAHAGRGDFEADEWEDDLICSHDGEYLLREYMEEADDGCYHWSSKDGTITVDIEFDTSDGGLIGFTCEKPGVEEVWFTEAEREAFDFDLVDMITDEPEEEVSDEEPDGIEPSDFADHLRESYWGELECYILADELSFPYTGTYEWIGDCSDGVFSVLISYDPETGRILDFEVTRQREYSDARPTMEDTNVTDDEQQDFYAWFEGAITYDADEAGFDDEEDEE